MELKKNLPFFNVVASGTASLDIDDLGPTYHAILLELGGTSFTKAHITSIIAKLNGKPFFTIDGTNLQAINDYKSYDSDVSYLMIDFAEWANKTIGGNLLGSIVTAKGISKFSLQVTISGATAPTLESYSLVSPLVPGAEQVSDLICGMISHPINLGAAGKFPIVLPYGPEAGHLIKRVYFFSNYITELEVKRNGVPIHGDMGANANDYFQTYFKRTPQAGLYVYDAVMTKDFTQMLDTSKAQTLLFNITVSQATTVDVYLEAIGKLSAF